LYYNGLSCNYCRIYPFFKSKIFKLPEQVERLRYIFTTALFLLVFLLSAGAQYQIHRVVIDAGHGGKDPGAIGKNSREKDIALAIALKTGEYIKKYLPDVDVIYTRKTDVFVELYRRAKIANDNKANLFISIHCNASKSTAASGTETYVMGLHKSTAQLEVAKLENAAILNEENFSDMYEGFDPNQDEDYITLTMFQDAFLEQSTMLADEIQRQFRERVNRKDRGVFQAGFLVLYKTTMPGVLVETGFISNANDERFLMSDEGQVYIASAIFRAFKFYKEEMERKDNKAQQVVKDYYKEPVVATPPPEVWFRVQFTSSKTKKVFDSKKYKDMPDIKEYKADGWYKYSTGNFKSYDEALRHQKYVRETKKFKDAFIICFLKNERISLEKALELIKK
jgi:N-acetylmuramoyl-L-alanine amidase